MQAITVISILISDYKEKNIIKFDRDTLVYINRSRCKISWWTGK